MISESSFLLGQKCKLQKRATLSNLQFDLYKLYLAEIEIEHCKNTSLWHQSFLKNQKKQLMLGLNVICEVILNANEYVVQP